VALRVDDVAPNGYAVDRATVRQSKTGRPVASSFELTDVTRHSLEEHLRATGRGPEARSRSALNSHERAGAARRRVAP
jgi:hypothetical protein